VKFDTASVDLGKSPETITIHYRVFGKPKGNFVVGIRKASDDSFALIAEWLIEGNLSPNIIRTAVVEGVNTYPMLANDLLSIEYPASSTDGLEIATSTAQGNLSKFTSQQYTETYTNTPNPLAITIKARMVT